MKKLLMVSGAAYLVVLLTIPVPPGPSAQRSSQGFVLQSREGPGRALAFSRDGKLLASAALHAVMLFDVAGRRELGKLAIREVWALVFSPDNRWLATGGGDGIVRIWDVKTRRQLRAFVGHTTEIQSLAFSPDGRWLFSAGEDATVIRWDTGTGKASATLGHQTEFAAREAVALSQDGLWLVEASGDPFKQGWRIDGEIRVWEIATNRKVNTLPPPIAEVLVIAISPDGRWVAAGTQERRVYIWDVRAGEFKYTLEHDDWVISLSFSADSRSLAAGSTDEGTVRVWEIDSGKQIAKLTGHQMWVRAVALRPDGSMIASSGDDESLRLWDLSAGREVALFSGFQAQGPGLAFTADGRQLAVASDGGVIRLWEVRAWRELEGFRGGCWTTYAMAFSPDGRRMASGDWCATLKLWDVPTRKIARTLIEKQAGIRDVAFSSDGRLLAWAGTTFPPDASSYTTIYILDMETGKLIRSWKEDRFSFLSRMEFLTNQTLAVISGLFQIEVRKVEGDSPVIFRQVIGDAVAVDRTGKVLAVAFRGKINWVDLYSERLVRSSSPFSGRLQLLRFSPDGRWLVSAGSDRTIRLWDVANGREVHSFRGHTDQVMEILFSPDGRWLVSGSKDKSVRVWDLSALTQLR